jgi:hypothetical protein
MRQLGHTDPGFTLRVYTHMMVRSPEERERLKALVRGERPARPESGRCARQFGTTQRGHRGHR